MIENKSDFRRYIAIEIPSNSVKQKVYNYLFLGVNSYILTLRKLELSLNTHNKLNFFLRKLLWLRFNRLSLMTGISIPPNVCDCGLTLYHYGSIVINANCKIGRNCCIMNNVNIGSNNGSDKAPIIGDNVYIGPGAVIFGDIYIADGCYIGANSVVNKSVYQPNSVIVGVPGKVIRYEPVMWWEKNRLYREK